MANEKFVMMAENPSGTGSFSINRKSGSTVGLKSHAEGDNTVASGLYSHSEGSGSAALGYMAHAEGNKTVASGSYAHAEGGSYELPDVTANSTAAEARAAWQAKRSTIAHGQFSHAEGSNTLALGNWAHTEGAQTIGSGSTSHAEGNNTEASGDSAHSEGMNTIASNYASHSSGKYNAAMTTGGTISNTVGTAFVVGNGTSSTVRSNALSVQYNGVVKAKSTITGSTTADYAEFFEWGDGNLNEEDRVGKFVTLVGDKIRIATNTDDYILGVVSGEPFVLGNGDCDTWNGMFLRDEYRRTIYEPAPKVVEILDEEGNPTGKYEEVAGQYEGIRPKLNPDYDPEQVYVSRFNRPEWAPIAMLGVVAVVHDGTAVVDGYVTVNASGIATASDKSAINSYRVIKSNSDSVVEILFTASKNHGHSYLPLAGGTVTGRVRFSDEETMYIDALGIEGNSNQTISGIYEIEAELFKGELRGNAESASTLSKTLGVAQGGTGETTLAAGQALIGNGTSKVTTRAITNLTSRSGISVNTNLITGSTLAYWNGAYNTSGNSNITYCYKGALGDAAVKGVDTTPTSGSANLITSGAMYTALAGKATSSHTHNYAGSSSAGGVATSAAKLSNTTAIGSATQPVYFNANGVPVACTYTLGKSVPSNAVFTDTHWTTGLVVGASATATANAAATNGNVHLNAMDNTVVRNAHKITGSGATTVTSDASGNITISSTNTTYSSFVKSGSGAKAGLVPAPSTTAGTTKYLREDGTWQIPPDTNTTYSNMTAATASAAGKAGLVPAPAAGKQTSFLRGDGTWVVPTDNDYRVTIANTNPTANTTYYPVWHTATSGTQQQLKANDGMRYNSLQGTTSAAGFGILSLGNSTGAGTAGNKYGRIDLYSTGTGAGTIQQAAVNSAVAHTLPTTGGTILNTGTTSFTQSLTTGTKVGTIKIDGTSTDIYAPTNTDTHYTTGIRVGASGTNSNAAATDPYLKVLDNTTYRSQVRLVGGGGTTVSSDANGNITISSTDTNTDTKVTQTNSTGNANYRVLLSANANDTNETNTALKSSKFLANPYTGAFTATKVYNAVWNDYAEWFEKEDIEEVFEPGDIVTWSEKGVTKTSDSNDSLVVGVYSDTYGHIVGGEELDDMEENRAKFVSVGLTGRVNVKVTGRVFRGDLIVSSDIPGVGTVNNNPIPGTVIGKALEDKEVEDVSKIKMLIMLG